MFSEAGLNFGSVNPWKSVGGFEIVCEGIQKSTFTIICFHGRTLICSMFLLLQYYVAVPCLLKCHLSRDAVHTFH